MHSEQTIAAIQTKIERARFFRSLLLNLQYYCWCAAVCILLEKRVLGSNAVPFFVGILVPIVVTLLQHPRNRVQEEQVLLWAEARVGGEGYLLLDALGGGTAWGMQIQQKLEEEKEALLPRFSFTPQWKKLFAAMSFFVLCVFVA